MTQYIVPRDVVSVLLDLALLNNEHERWQDEFAGEMGVDPGFAIGSPELKRIATSRAIFEALANETTGGQRAILEAASPDIARDLRNPERTAFIWWTAYTNGMENRDAWDITVARAGENRTLVSLRVSMPLDHPYVIEFSRMLMQWIESLAIKPEEPAAVVPVTGEQPTLDERSDEFILKHLGERALDEIQKTRRIIDGKRLGVSYITLCELEGIDDSTFRRHREKYSRYL